MRKVVVTEFVSLDGVMEEPAWTFPYWNDEIAEFKGEESSASDALLLGRVTSQGLAGARVDLALWGRRDRGVQRRGVLCQRCLAPGTRNLSGVCGSLAGERR